MADAGGAENAKSETGKNEKTTGVERKPSRRSPTTGHVRKKKSEMKRSQSTPREVTTAATSSDDEGHRKAARRASVSPGPEPKKVLRRRHRVKEKSQEPKDPKQTNDLTTDPDPPKTQSPIKPTTEPPKTESLSVQNDHNNDKPQLDDKPEVPKTDASKPPVNEKKATIPEPAQPKSWFGGWPPFKRKQLNNEAPSDLDTTADEPTETEDEMSAEFVKLLTQTKTIKKQVKRSVSEPLPVGFEAEKPLVKENFLKSCFRLMRDSRVEFAKYKKEYPKEVETLRRLRNRCMCEFVLMFIFCGCGAFLFKTTEGAFESFYKCGVKRVKRDFIDDLWRSSHYMKEDEWKSKARRRLWEFENQLHEAFDAGMTSYSGQRSWSFINGIIYCLTVVTTIGYGHIAPVTNSGRALTIAYSIIGIPLFLILLADFGKLFTRGIKFLWAFVRRVYYTGSCRTVRRTAPVQEVMKGMQLVYESIRRPSMFTPDGDMKECGGGGELGGVTPGDPPSTPALSAFAIDDEFNLPISVAIFILLIYIFLGATVFWIWEEDWSFFEAFYFVFISMSTIGFGDLVPKNQMYMMASIVYLAFGLALTSMCINVVQEKLSDTFRKASAKIGATIGLKVSDDDGTISPVTPTHVEIAEVHKSTLNPPPQVP